LYDGTDFTETSFGIKTTPTELTTLKPEELTGAEKGK
jgi:hypothetical protein